MRKANGLCSIFFGLSNQTALHTISEVGSLTLADALSYQNQEGGFCFHPLMGVMVQESFGGRWAQATIERKPHNGSPDHAGREGDSNKERKWFLLPR